MTPVSDASDAILGLSRHGRRAVEIGEWARVHECARQILESDRHHPEGHFLWGLAEKAARRPRAAASAFEAALAADSGRYDAAIELAYQYGVLLRHAEARKLLQQFTPRLENSPLYLNLAGMAYSMLSLHGDALPLYRKAYALQPGVDLFQANLASCSVFMGAIDEARTLYRALLDRFPNHQRNHYQLARIERARDATHVEEMKSVLKATQLPHDRNIFLYYALGKELEDLERWEEAFEYYRLAGDTISEMGKYDVAADLQLIERVMETCTSSWLSDRPAAEASSPAPIFIVGLPRTGTTLTERILSSHSCVSTLGETRFLEMALLGTAGQPDAQGASEAIIATAARADSSGIARRYREAAQYRLEPHPYFIDKLPENILHAGFIAKGFANARIVHLRRHPMDACFAMYKQSFFKFAYSLNDIGRYYVAYSRLARHWREVIGDRWIDVDYESLVSDPDRQIRQLLERVGLEFEPACLAFERNTAHSATASAAQVREKAHTRSIGRWKHFASPLEPLRKFLIESGIDVA